MSESDFSAIPSALGYLYQVRYALLLLLESEPDAEIGLEKLDDVSFENDGMPVDLLQIKFHLKQTASLTDSSSELWKTLRIWSERLHREEISGTQIRLTLISTAIAPVGSAASLLRPGDERDSERALELLIAAAERSENVALKSAFESFGRLSPDQKQQLINAMIVLDHSPDMTQVRERMERVLRLSARPEHLPQFTNRLESWWYQRVIELWISNPSGVITWRELHSELDDLRDQFQREALPADFLDRMDKTVDEVPRDKRFFIEQLRKVKVGQERLSDAISDYFRAFEQRSKWVREELVWQTELDRYDDRLVEQWRGLFYAVKEDVEDSPDGTKTERGRHLYSAIIDSPHHIPIRSGFRHPYVMRGSYHMLANVPRVCWHPDFECHVIVEKRDVA